MKRLLGSFMGDHGGRYRLSPGDEKAGLEFVRIFHREWPDPIEGDEHGDVEYALNRAAGKVSR